MATPSGWLISQDFRKNKIGSATGT